MVIVGCSGNPSVLDPGPVTSLPPASASHESRKVRDLCEPLRDFYTEVIGASDIRIKSVRDLDAVLSGSGDCHVEGGGLWRGYVRMRPASDGTDPELVGDFQEVPGYSAEMWIQDVPPGAQVEFATRVNGWIGKLQLNLGDGGPTRSSELTDDQQTQAAEFIIALTRRLYG